MHIHNHVRVADRDNHNKRKLSLILDAPHAIDGVVEVMEFGTRKYARRNWKKGFPFTEIVDSLLRHLIAYSEGQNIDADSGLLHVDHITCNALFLAELTRTRPEFDDRDPDILPTKSLGAAINSVSNGAEVRT